MFELKKIRRDVYDAETLHDVCVALLRSLPRWVPWVSVGASITMYVVFQRVRLCIARWRRAAQKRALRRTIALCGLHNCSPLPGQCVSLAGDDDDENANCNDSAEVNNDWGDADKSTVMVGDIEEFCNSLGIFSPRDDDLAMLVEEMLLVDPIPDDWVLYRTSAGVLRFMNLNTHKLFFFHPGEREKEKHILEELRRRRKVSIKTKYSFFTPDSGCCNGTTNAPFESWKQRWGRSFVFSNNGTDNALSAAKPSLLFGDDIDSSEEKDEQSTFRRLFHYFIDRENGNIDKDVEKRNGIRDNSLGNSVSDASLGEARALRILSTGATQNKQRSKRIEF